MMGLVLGLAVVCAGLVAYGVLTHEEPGFKNPSMAWDKAKFPLPIAAGTYSSEGDTDLTKEHRATLKHSMDSLNRRAGFKVVRWAKEGERGLIRMSLGGPTDETWESPGGHYVLHGNGATKEWLSCTVQTANTGTLELLYLVLYHEMGHCLGLDHDDYKASIMHPTLAMGGTFSPWISDFDKGLLFKTYAP